MWEGIKSLCFQFRKILESLFNYSRRFLQHYDSLFAYNKKENVQILLFKLLFFFLLFILFVDFPSLNFSLPLVSRFLMMLVTHLMIIVINNRCVCFH